MISANVSRSHAITNRHEARSSRPIWLGMEQRQWDHVRVHAQVIQDPDVGANELAVYLGLVLHAELQTGRCFPAIATLAHYAGIHPATARRALQRLISTGYVSVQTHQGRASEYSVLAPPAILSEEDEGDFSPPIAESAGVDIHSHAQSARGHAQSARGTPCTDRDEQEPFELEPNNDYGAVAENLNEACGQCDGTGWVERGGGVALCDCRVLTPSR